MWHRQLVPQSINQWRHLTFGFFIFLFSIGLICSEAQQPCRFATGFWVGACGMLSAGFAFACGFITNTILLMITCFVDFSIASMSLVGATVNLIFLRVQGYAIGWLSVVLSFFLLFDGLVVLVELGYGRCIMSNSSLEECGPNVHAVNCPAPPIDFVMPDAIPKPPNYDQISVRGLPPEYYSLSRPPTPCQSQFQSHPVSMSLPPHMALRMKQLRVHPEVTNHVDHDA